MLKQLLIALTLLPTAYGAMDCNLVNEDTRTSEQMTRAMDAATTAVSNQVANSSSVQTSSSTRSSQRQLFFWNSSSSSSSSDDDEKHGKHHRRKHRGHGRKHRGHGRRGKHGKRKKHCPWKCQFSKWKKWMHSHQDLLRHFKRQDSVDHSAYPSQNRAYCQSRVTACNALEGQNNLACNAKVELQFRGQTRPLGELNSLINNVCQTSTLSHCRCRQLMRYASKNPNAKTELAGCLGISDLLQDKEIMLGINFRAARKEDLYRLRFWYDYRTKNFPHYTGKKRTGEPEHKSLDCGHAEQRIEKVTILGQNVQKLLTVCRIKPRDSRDTYQAQEHRDLCSLLHTPFKHDQICSITLSEETGVEQDTNEPTQQKLTVSILRPTQQSPTTSCTSDSKLGSNIWCATTTGTQFSEAALQATVNQPAGVMKELCGHSALDFKSYEWRKSKWSSKYGKGKHGKKDRSKRGHRFFGKKMRKPWYIACVTGTAVAIFLILALVGRFIIKKRRQRARVDISRDDDSNDSVEMPRRARNGDQEGDDVGVEFDEENANNQGKGNTTKVWDADEEEHVTGKPVSNPNRVLENSLVLGQDSMSASSSGPAAVELVGDEPPREDEE